MPLALLHSAAAYILPLNSGQVSLHCILFLFLENQMIKTYIFTFLSHDKTTKEETTLQLSLLFYLSFKDIALVRSSIISRS